MNNIINQSINNFRLSKLRITLEKVNHYRELYAELSDMDLRAKTIIFKNRLAAGETLDMLLPEAYAAIREASKRVLGMFPKDVQVLGAIVMHEGNIAEMQTGEGKTLTATMPLFLNALAGGGVFLVTTNDYLAKRDFEEMSPLFKWMGVTVNLGFIDEPNYIYKPGEKSDIFSADIIYTTNGRIGFDYLMDNLADNKISKFLPDLRYAIIDEIDSVILDSAQTPLVISGNPRVQSNLFGVVNEFIETLIVDEHYEVDVTKKEIFLTEKGIAEACRYFNIPHLYTYENSSLIRNINLSLRAKYLFEINTDYIVFNRKIVLIDKLSGRLLHGTKLQSGLHQAIEAKEHVDISGDMSVMATITFQNLFKQFESFSGMSGTAKLGEKEFSDLYAKIVIQIPTDKKIQRIDLPDRVFLNIEDKNKAIIKAVKEHNKELRPVLIITRSLEAAENLSNELNKINIPNNLLTAQNVAKEAQMIAEAGQLGAVTVATNMAGRGTDIKLAKEVYSLGGLAVIINEHMENSRIDRQLKGRAGRQGDPGSSQIYISLEDYIVTKWSDNKMREKSMLMNIENTKIENSLLFKKHVKNIVNKAQKISEEQGILAREISNEYEKSISVQRELIYKERNKILLNENFSSFNFEKMAMDVFSRFVKMNRELNQETLLTFIYKNISFQYNNNDIAHLNINDKQNVIQFLFDLFKERLVVKEKEIGSDYFLEYLQKAMLKAIDSSWVNQVDNLQQLKSSVNNRQNSHRNAILEYHREALESYQFMTDQIQNKAIKNICLSMVTFDHMKNLIVHFP